MDIVRRVAAPEDRPVVLGVALIAAVALLLRVGAAVDSRDRSLQADPADYDRHGLSIAHGHGYPETLLVPVRGPTALRPPLLPVLLGGVYAVSGDRHRLTAARLFEAALGTLTVLLIGLIGCQLFGRAVGLVSMALAAVYPPLVFFGTSVLTEPLFLPLELGAFAAVIQHRRSPHRFRWALIAGVLAGLATLTRSNGVILLLPLALAAITGRPRLRRSALAPAAALVAAAILVVAPWTVRNAVEMDSFIPVALQTGYVLAGQYNDTTRTDPTFPGGWISPQFVRPYAPLFRTSKSEVELDKRLRTGVRHYVGKHSGYVPTAFFWNAVRFFDLDGPRFERVQAGGLNMSRRLSDASVYAFYLVGLMALVGVALGGARRIPAFIWLYALLLFVDVSFISGAARYRLPLDPFFLMLAAYALVRGWQAYGPRRRSA
jgi:4-amino-4-deoxy-L-arabinose transferase-like glycosyltransferase